MSESERIQWMKRENTPAHLWPEMVRCHCGAPVEKVGVKPRGHVVWVCENGHDDVAEDFMRRVRSENATAPPDSENKPRTPTHRPRGGGEMSEIEPALTAREWAEWGPGRDRVIYDALSEGFNEWSGATPEALAALCLHNKPFGFTWEDVDAIREAAWESEGSMVSPEGAISPDPDLTSLADRIAALLPPRD